jgi:hypothetical protein
MEIVLVIETLILIGVIAYTMFGSKKPVAAANNNLPSTSAAPARSEDSGDYKSQLRKAENDLDKKRKEMEQLKVELNETKADLKEARRKLHDDKETGKIDKDLVKARAEVEREASIQLEATRAELANALAEIQRLKSDADPKRKSAPVQAVPAPAAEAAPVPAPAAAPEKPVVQKVIRELSEADKEKIQRAEATAAKDRARAQDLERDLRGARNRSETLSRQLRSQEKDLTLVKDKFRALELRSNRLMLQNELLNRALKDLEKKSGIGAGRLELTPEEITRSDQAVQAKQKAEDQAEAEAQARLQAAEATSAAPAAAEAAPPPPAPAAEPVEAPKPSA